ncbi:MAG: guanylate kinase [Fimbriimonadaceae bacterium]|nr:guanylate kinase [Fimbriimonadaceae bacterium]
MIQGRPVILSGPSGVGKDTVIAAWQARNPRVRRVVACTTRSPRPGEVDGVDYRFLSDEEFRAQAEAGEFLEHMIVHGRGYATPWQGLQAIVDDGGIALLKIDVQGAEAVRRQMPNIVSIFLLPPTREELERRIRERGTEDEAALALRLKNAEEELAQAARYDHQVVNSDVEETVDRLEEIVRG